MTYEYQYHVFIGVKPLQSRIKDIIDNKYFAVFKYYREDSLSNMAETIVGKYCFDWGITSEEEVLILVCPKDKPEETELFNVHIEVFIQTTATPMKY